MAKERKRPNATRLRFRSTLPGWSTSNLNKTSNVNHHGAETSSSLDVM